VSAPSDYDNGEIGGMIGRGNRSTRRKPAPLPLCPPQTPHSARTRTRAAAVGSQRLTPELRHGQQRDKKEENYIVMCIPIAKQRLSKISIQFSP
jgi:hypothetical protein